MFHRGCNPLIFHVFKYIDDLSYCSCHGLVRLCVGGIEGTDRRDQLQRVAFTVIVLVLSRECLSAGAAPICQCEAAIIGQDKEDFDLKKKGLVRLFSQCSNVALLCRRNSRKRVGSATLNGVRVCLRGVRSV